jgi:hypothetical protein
MWTKEHREAHRQSGNGFPSDLDGRAMGATGATDPGDEDRRATAQDRHACGNECDFLFAAHRLLVVLSTGRSVSATLEVYNIFRKFQREGVWERIGRSCSWPCANNWAARPARQPSSNGRKIVDETSISVFHSNLWIAF